MDDAALREILATIEPGDYARALALVELGGPISLRAALTMIIEERNRKRESV